MSLSVRLQDLVSVDEDTVQPNQFVIDILGINRFAVSVRVPVAMAGGGVTATLYLQHAAVNEEDAFSDIGTGAGYTVSLTATGTTVLKIDEPVLRFLRWRVGTTMGPATTPAQFLIDLVGRDRRRQGGLRPRSKASTGRSGRMPVTEELRRSDNGVRPPGRAGA